MKTTKNTPKIARKQTASRKKATLPEIYAEGYETRVVYPAANVPTPRPVIVGKARAIGEEPDAMRTAVVGFRGAGLTAGATATQPPALPSFR